MAQMNDWDRIVIRSMQRACDGTSEGVKKAWETRKHGGGSPQRARSNTHEGVTSYLKGMLEKLKRKAMPGKYSTTTKHTPGTSKRDPKTGNIIQTAGRTETVSRPKTGRYSKPPAKKADDPFKDFKKRSEKQNTSGPRHTGEVKAKAPAPREYKPSETKPGWKPFVGWDHPSTWHGRGE